MKICKTGKTKIRLITNIITALILTFFIGYLIVEWKNIPDIVATHFTISGKADAYGEKNCILIIPIIAVLVFSTIAVVERFPNIWNFPVKVTEENREKLINNGLKLTGVLKMLLSTWFCYIGFCSAKGMPLSLPSYVFLVAVAIAIIVGIYKMVKDR